MNTEKRCTCGARLVATDDAAIDRGWQRIARASDNTLVAWACPNEVLEYTNVGTLEGYRSSGVVTIERRIRE